MIGKEDLSELEEYQEFVAKCPQPPSNDFKGYWAASQMTCEAAEVLTLFEKAYRKGMEINPDDLIDELGDALWGIAAVCNAEGITLDEVIMNNIQKLTERFKLNEAAK